MAEIKHFYLFLCVIGIILPYSQFIPFFAESGADMGLFFSQAFSSYTSTALSFDLFVAGLTLIAFILYEGRKLKMPKLWIPIASIFLVGVSLGFPLFLYLREIHLESKK